ncbi:hypothetical protein KY284_010797 [Solanum tuberosum]|nr:hypothetical protein KY284_010797 [Solanum tuberosum]
MAREPPVELSRPPDEDQLERHGKSNKTHLATPHNSSYSSSNSQNTEAINTAISERELDGIRKVISPEVHVSIHGKSITVMKSPNHDLYATKNPTDSIVPIERSREANLERNANKSPEVRTQIRRSSSQVLADSTTGDYSPQLEVHLTEIWSEMDGGIIGEEDSGETRGQIAGVHGTSDRGINSPAMDIHLSDIPNNVNGGNIRNTNPRQSMDTPTDDPMTLNRRKFQATQHIEEEIAAMETHNPNKQQDTNQSNEAQSSNFSFGIVGNSRNLTSPLSSDAMQVTAIPDKGVEEPDKDQQKKAQEPGQGHQEQITEPQDIPDQHKITERNKDNQQQRNGQLQNETNVQSSR